FAKAVESDKDGSTDASDRLAELDGVEFVDAIDENEHESEHEGEVRSGGDVEVVEVVEVVEAEDDEDDEDVDKD
ncbi:MAG: hypothetical protein HOV70_04085, partial [Streptomyces sp.]|nr:hypothetical protein [Streptomyces sp.]